MKRGRQAHNLPAYPMQIRIPSDVRALFDSLTNEQRKLVKDRIMKQFIEEFELCVDQGDDYEPVEIAEE